MSSEKTLALTIRTVDFSETSLVVTFYTRDFGKIGCLAKGGRRLKGPFESALDVLTLSRIVFLHKASDALDLATEAKLVRRFRPAENRLPGLYAGYYVAELLDELTEENEPNPALFDLAELTLVDLARETDESETARLVNRFEMGLLRLLGIAPALDRCANCGTKSIGSGRVALGLWDGGLLCRSCREGKRQVVSISPGARTTLQALADSDPNRWKEATWTRAIRGELRGILNHYFSHLLGKKPRLQPYLR